MPKPRYSQGVFLKLRKLSSTFAAAEKKAKVPKTRVITVPPRMRIKSAKWPTRIKHHFKGKDQVIARRLIFHMGKGEVTSKDGLIRITLSSLKRSKKIKLDPLFEVSTVGKVFDKLVSLKIIEYAPRGFGKEKK